MIRNGNVNRATVIVAMLLGAAIFLYEDHAVRSSVEQARIERAKLERQQKSLEDTMARLRACGSLREK